MIVGIIGAATVGTTLGEHFAKAGHKVLITNSRGPETLADKLAGMSQPLEPVTMKELADEAEIIILAMPWHKVKNVLLTDIRWDGRVVIDAMNIFGSYDPIQVDDLQGDSGSEIVARLAPSARVVKAFNTLPFEKMFAPVPEGFRRVLFVAGDDQDAVSAVTTLIDQIGFRAVAIGELATAGRQMELGGVFSTLELFAPESQ
ncbi:putative dinucleotide-binding enzyme [Sphingobium xenophagum]|uniref:Dinucleotide-binding enzyme n=2 Tax=Sphingobium xenophagum TaxID=121428 RepID=A0ABU1X539_SPHXE|nr:putative dinucleotide-binding enzyme [Sphingobium xenophagum]